MQTKTMDPKTRLKHIGGGIALGAAVAGGIGFGCAVLGRMAYKKITRS